jgi:hypothetical protein
VKLRESIQLSLLVALLTFYVQQAILAPGPGPVPPGPVNPATAATYIYEKDDTAVPVAVSTGINRLNREKKIVATLFEEDTRDGNGEVPDQYKAPLGAAQQAGLPALVVTNGEKVLNVVKDPKTEAEVWGAVQ